MKYFLFLVIFAATFVIFYTGSHRDIWKNIQRLQIDEQPVKEETKQQESKDDQKIQAAYALLEAIVSVEKCIEEKQRESIFVWQKNHNIWEKHAFLFRDSDYELIIHNNEEKLFLKERSLQQFYYQLDNIALKEFEGELLQKVSSKLKERYDSMHNYLVKIKEKFLSKQNIPTPVSEENTSINTEKIEDEESSSSEENKIIEEFIEEVVENENTSTNEAKEEDLNIINHSFFPFGENYYWKYRVLKFADKSISSLKFRTISQSSQWYWQYESGEKKKISVENGYIQLGLSRVFPCSLEQKSWSKAGYLMYFAGEQTISTDFGSFNVIVYQATNEINSKDEKKEYYAEGIGLVKEERFLSGKKIYEKILIDCHNKTKSVQQNKEYPFNANFYPMGEGCFWEYDVLKLSEGRISFIRLDMSRENNSWKLKDSTGYSPTIAIAEDFVMQGLEKLIPPYTKKTDSWQRGNFKVKISHFGEIVTTNAGTFECLVVVAKDQSNTGYIQKEYYAHNVGEVKREIYNGTEKIYERILHSYQNQYKK